jgi:subtilase family serine protease
VLIAGCSGSMTMPQTGHARNTADTAQAMPGDTAQAMTGDTAQAMTGDTAQAMTGAQLACGGIFNLAQAHCTVAINIELPSISNLTTPSNLLPGLHPADLQSAYSLPSQNSGGTVAIVDAYDDPVAETDLAVYRAAFGLPPCTSLSGCFRKVNQQGGSQPYPAIDTGWDTEISLDLDMVSAACPNCKILLVEANSASFDDLGAAVDTAASMGATAISNSYYGTEWPGETAEDAHYNHPGTAITVSAGDQVSTFYPAASPYVTSVGGTALSGSSGSWSEAPWGNGGRGCSLYEPKPKYQAGLGCGSARSTVDVSAVADPKTGVAMYDSTSGGWLVAGGTSVGAPLVAAAYALSGNVQSPAYSYAHPAAFHDVAPAGYDAATGLGSPNGVSGL